MERTKLGLSKDKMYKALGEGERTSKKVSSIRMSDGSTFKRKNANQYGAAEGGNDYTEKRSNRTDRFDLGGTADSSNTGANMGGTMGSSVMKKGGGVIEEDDIVIVKSSKLKGRVTNKGTDFVTIEYIGKRPSGGDKRGSFKLSQLKLVSEYANGGGLANTPESFPSNDAVSYKTGGEVGNKTIKKRLEQLRKELRAERISYGELAELQSLAKYIDKNDVELLEAAGVPEFDENDKHAEGGSTKSFEYTIGGL